MTHRYERGDPVMLYQQQKSHYEHLYNPRNTYKIITPERKSQSLYYKNKTLLEKERLRKIQNKKMLVSLLDIYNGNGLLIKMGEESKKRDSSIKKSLFLIHKKEEQLKKQNKMLRSSIEKVEPSIGTKQQWKKHYEQHLELQKKLLVTGVNQCDMPNYVVNFHRKQKVDNEKLLQATKDVVENEFTPIREKRKRKMTKNKLKFIKKQEETNQFL